MKLTQQQIDDFNRDGWLFLPELFSAEEVRFLAYEAKRIYDTTRPGRGNQGHTFGDMLTEPERRTVIEYLKTL